MCLINKYLCPDSSFVKYRVITRIRRSTTKQVGQEILSEVDIIHMQEDLLEQFSLAHHRKKKKNKAERYPLALHCSDLSFLASSEKDTIPVILLEIHMLRKKIEQYLLCKKDPSIITLSICRMCS